MWFIEKVKNNKLLKISLIIISIPFLLVLVYYLNLSGVYFGTFLRRLITGFKC